jgi:hypothetical protein
MKRKSMLASLALLMTSGAALGEASYLDAVLYTTWAKFAGSKNRCPRFRMIERAISTELAEARVTAHEMEYYGDDWAPPTFVEQYNENPSEFCDKAWKRLGPNGTYKRQMLEAK